MLCVCFRCDSKDVVVRLEWSLEEFKFHVLLMNLSYTSMDYASHHNAEVTITLAGGQQYTAQISGVARAIELVGHRCACAKALTTPTN